MRCRVGQAAWLLVLLLTVRATALPAAFSTSTKCDGAGCTSCQLQCGPEPSFRQCQHECTSCEAAAGQRFELNAGTCECRKGAGFTRQPRCSSSGGTDGSSSGKGGSGGSKNSKTFLPLQYQQVVGAWAAAKQQQAAADAASLQLQELQAAVQQQAAKLSQLHKQAAAAAAARQRNATSQQAAAFVDAGSLQTASPAVAAAAATSAAEAEQQLARFRAALQQLQAAKAAAAGAAHAASRANATAVAVQRTAAKTEKRFWLHKRRRHQFQPPPSYSGDPSCYSWVPCTPCAAGTVSAGGVPAQSFCEPCPAGSKPNSDQSSCVPASPQPSPPPPPPPPSKSNTSVKAPPRAIDASAFTTAPRPVFVLLGGSGGVPPLTLSIVGRGPLRGQLEAIDQARRRVLYTPAYAFCSSTGQPDEFQYRVTDARGKTATAKAKVFVDCPGVACDNLWAETELRTPVLLTAVVAGGAPPFEAKITYQPSGATITAITSRGRSITFTYQPFTNYCSLDGFSDYFEFEVTDRYGSANTAAADVTVACPPPGLPPALLLEMPAGGGPLAVDMQLDPALAPYVFDVYQPPMNGDATDISTAGVFDYRPSVAYCNNEWPDVISFTLYDVFGASADGSVSITVVCPPPPAFRPNAGDGSPVVFTTAALTAISQQLNFEAQGRPLQVFTSLFPQNGIIEWQDVDQGLFIYAPDDSYCSTTGQLQPWTFEIVDIYDQRSSGTVFFKVLCPSPPVLTVSPAALTAVGGVGLAVDMQLSSGGSLPPYRLVVVSSPKLGRFGKLAVLNNTNAILKYIPRYGWCTNENVTDTFSWRIWDRFGQQSGDATCSVTVTCPPPPTAAAQSASLAAGESLQVQLEVTGQPPLDFVVSKTLLGQKKVPKVNASETGDDESSNVYTVTYSPGPGFCTSGGPPDVLRYRVFDVFGQSANGSVAFDVACPGGLPP